MNDNQKDKELTDEEIEALYRGAYNLDPDPAYYADDGTPLVSPGLRNWVLVWVALVALGAILYVVL